MPLLIFALLWTHFVADFLFQSDWMALNKSKNWLALLSHVGVYSLCFFPLGVKFVFITFVTHFLTDAITSRAGAALWTRGARHWFFVVIGLDQFIHQCTLILTLYAVRGSIL